MFDRPKTIALKWGRDGVVTDWNPTFAGVALDLGIGVEVCWPYRPQEPALRSVWSVLHRSSWWQSSGCARGFS